VAAAAAERKTHTQVALRYADVVEEAQRGLVHRRRGGVGAERLPELFPLSPVLFQGRQKGGAVRPHVERNARIPLLAT
jgi:hypothetical protein